MNRRSVFLILALLIPIAGIVSWRSCAPTKSPAVKEEDLSSHEDDKKTNVSDPNLAQKKKNENSEASTDAIKTEIEFLNRYPGNWMFKRAEKGKLNYITGGIIPNSGRSPASIKDFANSISPLLEARPKDLSQPKEISRTDLSRVYQMFQSSDGYDVYQSMLSIHVRESDDAIFMINNQLKDITGYNKEMRYDQKQAEAYIQNKYQGEIASLQFKSGPVIFTDGENPGELAWVFLMTYKQPALHMVEIVVGANSGEEIHQQSMTIQ